MTAPSIFYAQKNAGILSVAAGWSALPRELYMQHEPDYVVESMEEFVALLEKLNGQRE